MRNGRFVRKLAGFLAALTLLQCGAPLTALAAEQEPDQIVAEVQQRHRACASKWLCGDSPAMRLKIR